VRHGDATIIYGGFDFPTRGGVKSEKRRPRPQEGNGRAWPAFIVRIANQQIKICDVEWQGKWELEDPSSFCARPELIDKLAT